jgi:hypothetical protein
MEHNNNLDEMMNDIAVDFVDIPEVFENLCNNSNMPVYPWKVERRNTKGSQDQTLNIDLQASPMSWTNIISILHGMVSMPSQHFDTTNHEKSQYDFAFKADMVPKLWATT